MENKYLKVVLLSLVLIGSTVFLTGCVLKDDVEYDESKVKIVDLDGEEDTDAVEEDAEEEETGEEDTTIETSDVDFSNTEKFKLFANEYEVYYKLESNDIISSTEKNEQVLKDE